MAVYVFKAKDDKGKIVTGKSASPSSRMVEKELEKHGLHLISLQPQTKWYDYFLAFTIRVRDRSIFYRQLAVMLKAGITITHAIEITKQTPNKYFYRVIEEISEALENGHPLSWSLGNYPRIFPQIDLGIIKAGEATGKLDVVLKELSVEAAKSAAFNSKVRNAMIYPAFIVVVLVAVAIVVMVKIIPPIKEIFDDAKVPLPFATQVVIGVSTFIIEKWWLALIIIAVFIGGLKLLIMTKKGKELWSSLKLNLPIFGQLQREVFLARFNRTFAMLLRAGVPIIEAVNIVGDMTSNVIYRRIVAKLSGSLEQGAPITSTLQSSKYFPMMMTQLLYVGQQTGDLSGMCETLAEYYEEEVENKLKTLSSLLEPLIIVVIGFGVAFVVVSVLSPIYNMTEVF